MARSNEREGNRENYIARDSRTRSPVQIQKGQPLVQTNEVQKATGDKLRAIFTIETSRSPPIIESSFHGFTELTVNQWLRGSREEYYVSFILEGIKITCSLQNGQQII